MLGKFNSLVDPPELMSSASFFFSYFSGIFKPIEFQVWGQDLDVGIHQTQRSQRYIQSRNHLILSRRIHWNLKKQFLYCEIVSNYNSICKISLSLLNVQG